MLVATLLLLPTLLQDTLAPAGTSADVRAYVLAADASLYHPEDHGLESLSFVVPYEESRDNLAMMAAQMGQPTGDLPEVLEMAEIQVHWDSEVGPAVAVEVSDELPPAMESIRTQLEAAMPQLGHQMLTAALGRVVDLPRFLEFYDAAFDGNDEAGRVLVRLARKPSVAPADAPAEGALWAFDSDGLPARSIIEIEQPTPMGAMTLTMTSDHRWAPSGLGDGSLILESVEVEMDMGFMGKQTQVTTYHYENVAGLLMVASVTERAERQAAAGAHVPPVQKTTRLRDVTVHTTVRDEG